MAAQSQVERHLAQAVQGVTAMADSTRWAEGAATIAAGHKKVLDALSLSAVGALGVSKLERSMTDEATMRAAAVGSLSAVDEAMKRAVEADRALMADARAAAVGSLSAVDEAMKRAVEADRALMADARASASGPNVTGLTEAMHRSLSATTHALGSYMKETELLSKTQFTETVHRLASASDLLDVARSAADTVNAVRLTQGFAADIGRLAREVGDLRVGDRPENFSPLDEIEDDQSLSAIVGPSLEIADPALLLVLVAVTVYPGLFGTAATHLVQILQQAHFWLRMLGKLTTVDDSIPGVLLLATLYGLGRR